MGRATSTSQEGPGFQYPWLDHYDESVPHHLDYPQSNIPRLFQTSVERNGDRIALEFMGKCVTYDALVGKVLRKELRKELPR